MFLMNQLLVLQLNSFFGLLWEPVPEVIASILFNYYRFTDYPKIQKGNQSQSFIS